MKFEDFEYNSTTTDVKWDYIYRDIPITIYPAYDVIENPFNHELLVPVLHHKSYNFPSVIDPMEIKARNDNEDDFFDDVVKTIEKEYGEIVLGFDIILGDHSGLWLSYRNSYNPPYHVGWDESFIGWIFITKKSIKNWDPSIKRITKKVKERIRKMWESEIFPMLDDYVAGEIYDIIVRYPDESEGHLVFRHKMNLVLEDIQKEIDHYWDYMSQQKLKRRIQLIKTMIKKKVPLEARFKKIKELEQIVSLG